MGIPEAVPPLQGRAKTLVGVVWWALFAVTFAAGLIAMPLSTQHSGDVARACGNLGLRCTLTSTGLMLGAPIDPALEARGIRAGQRILGIDGHAPPMNQASATAALLEGPDGGVAVLVVATPAGQRHDTPTPNGARWMRRPSDSEITAAFEAA